MSRIPPAAQLLIDEVEAHDPDATFEVIPEADGLGVYRTILFTGKTAKWLDPVLRVAEDPRIASAVMRKSGLEVIFVADTRADFVQPFNVGAAAAVFDADTAKGK